MNFDTVTAVISMYGGSKILINCLKSELKHFGDKILDHMNDGTILICECNNAVVAAVRGSEITGFHFEAQDPNLLELEKKRIQAEINHLDNMSSGDEWKY